MGFQGTLKDPLGTTVDDLALHTLDPDSHHARFTDEEARAAAVNPAPLSPIEGSKAATHIETLNAIAIDANLSALAQDAIAKSHDGTLQAAKVAAVSASDAVVSSVIDAPAQTASYVQADVQALTDLVNDLKARYNASVTLINELKSKLDAMNA